MDVVRFALLGIGAGAIYALAAQGIVMVYRGSGVLNFAHGAIGMVAAFVFYDLRGAPGLPAPLCFLVAILVAAATGAATHLCVMRPLRHASGLARLIATLGVLTVLQAAGSLIWTDGFRVVTGILPDGSVRVFANTSIGADRFYLLGIAAVLTIVLMAVYRYTRFGLATGAVAENRRATAALGRSPDVVATLNWAAGAALAGTAAILIVPLTSLQVDSLTLLVIPALAAALVGGFASFPMTLLGGMAIGVAESEMSRYMTASGWSKSVPFLAIIAVLVLRGQALPLRGESAERPPELGTGRVQPVPLAVAAGAAALLIWFGFPASWLEASMTTLTVGIVVLSLVVVTGFAGQLSLAQFALAGMGAWTAARAVADYHVGFGLAMIIGVACAVPIGVLVGLPALRARGVNLAVATLGLALVIEEMVFNNTKRTGGLSGTTVGNANLFGLDLGTAAHARRYALFLLIVFVLLALLVSNLRRGRAGRRLIAVRTNERAATALGISVTGAKLYAFGLSAGIAGLGGVLIAFRNPFVQFGQFTIFNSITAVLLAVIGGVGYVLGGALGGAIAPSALFPRVFDALFGNIEQYVKVISGILLLSVVIGDPNGLASAYTREWKKWVGRLRRTTPARALPAAVPSAVRSTRVRLPPATLRVEGLTVRFGGVLAVDGVSLAVEPGEVVGLIGPNGAGKTTLIDAITGFVRPSEGRIIFNDEAIEGWSAGRRARAGLGRSFQSLELFESMTVRDNLRAASDDRDRLAYLSDLVHPGNPDLSATAWAAVADFRLAADLDRRPDELPFGRRRLVAIARAAATGPSTLLLDEPAAGLDAHETRELGDLLVGLAHDGGIGVLLVEHDVSFVFRTCDRVVALDFGHCIAQGLPEAVASDPAVIKAYLGAGGAPTDPTDPIVAPEPIVVPKPAEPPALAARARADLGAPAAPGPLDKGPILRAAGLTAGYGGVAAVHEIDLSVEEGEIVALLGPNGAGKTTTLLTLAGDLPPLGGHVVWRGEPISTPLHDRARRGLGLVTEERSVFMRMSAAANLRLGRGDPREAVRLFPELAPLLSRRAGLLSGGEQQILTLARALAAQPKLLLADELSLGLAPIIVDRLLEAIRHAADQGMGVLLVEQHVHRALAIADRAVVLNRGRVVLSGTSRELRGRQEEIERSYLRAEVTAESVP